MSVSIDKTIDEPAEEEWSHLKHDSRLTHEQVRQNIKTYCDQFTDGVGVFVDSEGLVCALFKFDAGRVLMSTRQVGTDGDHAQAVSEVQQVKNSISGI